MPDVFDSWVAPASADKPCQVAQIVTGSAADLFVVTLMREREVGDILDRPLTPACAAGLMPASPHRRQTRHSRRF